MEGEGDLQRKIKGPSFIRLGYRIILITASKCWQGVCAREWRSFPDKGAEAVPWGDLVKSQLTLGPELEPDTTAKARNLPCDLGCQHVSLEHPRKLTLQNPGGSFENPEKTHLLSKITLLSI